MSEPVAGITPEIRSKLHLFGAYCALSYMGCLLMGWAVVAGFFPPVQPDWTEAEIAQLFAEDANRIKLGMILVMAGAAIFIPFAGTLVTYVRKVEGEFGLLTISVLMFCVGNMMLTFVPAMTWTVAAYRPDRDPAVTYLVSDMAWLWWVGGASILLMMIPVAATSLLDRSPDPIFPRWLGYLNIWIALLIIPDQMLFFFHSGPFAWNGLIGIYIPLTVFTTWFLTAFWCLRRAVLRDRAQAGSTSVPTPEMVPA